MTGAMYASIAGLKTHMQKLNVIGNNVANVNTAGYKSKRTVFQDSVYTQYSSGANGTNTMAGINPSQIGYGVRISTIDINMTTGSYNPGMPTDCMLDGDGFFLVGRKDVAGTIDPENPNSFKSLTLTRVGNFEFKEDGYFANQAGDAVYGFQVVGYDTEGKPIVSDQLVPLRLPEYEMVEVENETTKKTELKYVLRWPVAATDGQKPAYGAVDPDDKTRGTNSDGVVLGEQLTTASVGDGNNQGQGTGTIAHNLMDYSEYIGDPPADYTGAVREFGIAKLESISVSANGAITGIVSATKEQITIGYIAVGNPTNPNGLTHAGGHYYTVGDGAGDLEIATVGNIGEELKCVGGGGKGIQYVNGTQVTLEDEQSLADVLSAKAAVGGTGKTTILGSFLEGSNADLATEISELITTQRGYQANTRIVTVTDSMLEELVNMKR